MNHADRQRLSQILEECACALTHTDDEGIGPLIDEARAIVGGPTTSIPDTNLIGGQYNFPPSATLDAFLSEPIHEYNPHPDYGRIRHPLGWTKPGRRHRALSTRRIALTTLIAGMILLALTASRTPTPSPSHQPTPERAAKPAPTTAQVPYRPGHQPGTPGNGLGVVTTP